METYLKEINNKGLEKSPFVYNSLFSVYLSFFFCLFLRLHPDLASRFTVARMHSALYVARSSNFPKIPKTLMYLGVLLGLPNMRPICKTTDGTDYMFQGVIGLLSDKTVSTVFASGRMLLVLKSRPNLHMDGTFKKRPRKPICRQIYNIVTNHGGSVSIVLFNHPAMNCLNLRFVDLLLLLSRFCLWYESLCKVGPKRHTLLFLSL